MNPFAVLLLLAVALASAARAAPDTAQVVEFAKPGLEADQLGVIVNDDDPDTPDPKSRPEIEGNGPQAEVEVTAPSSR